MANIPISSRTMDESNCAWVSSRGILKCCERRNRHPKSSSRHIDPDILTNLKDHDVLHICSWLSISIFMTTYAKKIDKKVIIVTNDSDFDSPVFEKPVGKGDEINKDAILAFLNSDRCVHWFTQNCTLDHPKVSPIPIGLDYHTLTVTHGMPCLAQERMLNQIRSNKRPFHLRSIRCYGNFHFGMDGKYYTSDRHECFNDVPKELVYYEPKMVHRHGTWHNQTYFSFVLSPAGGGYDCHRTWEALILGCIPIVRRFNIPMERLYDDLPVLIVDKWSDVSEDLLKKTVNEFSNKAFNYDKLTLKYWMNMIYSHKPQFKHLHDP